MRQKLRKSKNLPQGWVKTTIGEISLRIHYGYTASATEENIGVKYLRISDISDSGVDWNKVPYCRITDFEIEDYQLHENDLLFARTGGTVGKSYLVTKDAPPNAVFASYLIRIITNYEINARYLSFFFQSKDYWNHIKINKTGLKTNVNGQLLSKIPMPLSPKNEQDRIVSKIEELLSELESGKKQLELVQKQIQVFKQGLLQQAFDGTLSQEWREAQINLETASDLINSLNNHRETLFKNELEKFHKGKRKNKPKPPEQIKPFTKDQNSKLSKLPNGWRWVTLKSICGHIEKVNQSERKFTKEFLYVDIGAIDNKANKIVNYKKYAWANAPSRAQQIIKVGDTLFSTVRTYLKNIAKVEDPDLNYQIGSTGFTVLRPEEGFINAEYLFQYVLSDRFINLLSELQTGSSYPAVRDKDVFSQFIPLCSKKEQGFIVKELERRFSICQMIEKSILDNLERSNLLKQTILQQAFEGKLVPQNPDEEPANVLLERIKEQRNNYLEELKYKKAEKLRTIKHSNMAERLKSLLELLQNSKKPISTHTLWQASEYKDDIDAFYAEIKKLVTDGKIEELPREGKHSYIRATTTT